MPVHPPAIVTVAYETDPHTHQPIVSVTPHVIEASPGQTIQFRRAGVMSGRMRLTFKDKEFFEGGGPQFAATGAFHEGDGDVRVKALPRRTTFVCELLDDNGKQIAQSSRTGGGAVEPVRT